MALYIYKVTFYDKVDFVHQLEDKKEMQTPAFS